MVTYVTPDKRDIKVQGTTVFYLKSSIRAQKETWMLIQDILFCPLLLVIPKILNKEYVRIFEYRIYFLGP